MSTSNKQGGGSAWSRPLNNNNRGRFGGSGGGGSGRAPPGMEGGRDAAIITAGEVVALTKVKSPTAM
jgi:hypothetical protein